MCSWNSKVRQHFLLIWTSSFYLEDLLGRSVDLVTEKALRKELRLYVEKKMIRVA